MWKKMSPVSGTMFKANTYDCGCLVVLGAMKYVPRACRSMSSRAAVRFRHAERAAMKHPRREIRDHIFACLVDEMIKS